MKKKVLVVEDEEMQAKFLANVLVKAGYEVFLCEEGVFAKSILSLDKFDLVLLDINIPNINGLKLLEIIRTNEQQVNFKTPVIICTATFDLNDQIQSMENRANEYLVKPILPEKIKTLAAAYTNA
jgi:DNA-binding response OmpR family regulator